MYLEIALDDGSTVDVTLSGTHSLRVIDPSGNTQESFAIGNVTDIKFRGGEPPEPATPAEPVATPEPVGTPSEPVTVAVTPQGDVVQGENGPAPVADPVLVPDTPVSEPTPEPAAPVDTPQPEPEPEPVADNGDVVPTPDNGVVPGPDPTGDPVPADPVDVPDSQHDTAVASADGAVDAVASAPDAEPEDKLAVLAAAQADVASALEQWPDSPALLDAKARLDELANDLTPPAEAA